MKCLYFVSEQTRRVFNNLLDYKMRDKNICIFAGMSNERDDPGTPDPEPAKEVAKKEGTTEKEPAKKATAKEADAKRQAVESLSESEDGQVTKILFTQFLTF